MASNIAGSAPKPALAPANGFQIGKIVALSICHFIHDAYSSFLAPLLPLLIEKLSLTLTQAGFLSAVAKGEVQCPLIDRSAAITLLGNMHGGYNIATLVELLDDSELGGQAATELKHTLLMFDAFHDVEEKAKAGNANAQAVLQS